MHAVGTDCAIGKMTAVLELNRAAEAAGEPTVFVPTGQVGVSVAGWGIAVDHVIADYVAGAAERLVIEGATRGDMLLVEGQGALYHPPTRASRSACCTAARRTCSCSATWPAPTAVDEWPDVLIPPLAELAAPTSAIAAPMRPAPVARDHAEHPAHRRRRRGARGDARACERETGRVCDDPVRFGAERLWQAVAAALPAR